MIEIKRHAKDAPLIPLILILALLSIPSSFAQVSGCCSNPGAGFFSCNTQTLVVRDTQCCPSPESSNPGFYISAQLPQNPQNYQDCASNYFQQNAACDGVAACKSGCCCEPSGPSTKTQAQCAGSGATFNEGKSCSEVSCAVPDCNDGLDNDNNGCADTRDSGCIDAIDTNEENGICSGSGQGCTNPLHTPKLSSLSIVPEKGKKQLRITFSDECGQNALSYDILRCKEQGCTNFLHIATISTPTFIDSSDALLFDTTYTYQIKAHYSVQQATPIIQA